MSTKTRFLIILLLVSVSKGYSQDSAMEYFIVGNGNFYLPGSQSGKASYPILWYDSDRDPSVMVGGFGIGFAIWKPLNEKVSLKAQGAIARQAYWNTSIQFRDGSNAALGDSESKGVDYVFNMLGSVHYSLTDNFSLGTGLSTQLLILSMSKLQEDLFTESADYKNNYYKPVMPLLPVEATLKLRKVMVTMRYEYGLLNRYKNDLADVEKEKFSLLTFEIGFKIH